MTALVPAIIAVCGVLTVGILQALVNRTIHIERLAREAAIDRRTAFTTYMAIMSEQRPIQNRNTHAENEVKRLHELFKTWDFQTDRERDRAEKTLELAHAENHEAARAILDWSIRRQAAQTAALATLDTPTNPLAMIPKLMKDYGTDADQSTAIHLDCMAAIHIDGELNNRKRRTAQRELTARLQEKYPTAINSA